VNGKEAEDTLAKLPLKDPRLTSRPPYILQSENGTNDLGHGLPGMSDDWLVALKRGRTLETNSSPKHLKIRGESEWVCEERMIRTRIHRLPSRDMTLLDVSDQFA
jgi:hypothetical protein